jgi:hypothetical protein
MRHAFSRTHLLVLVVFLGVTSASGQPAFTEIISPADKPGAQFGAYYGGLPDLTGDGVGEFYVFGGNQSWVYNGASLEILFHFSSAGCAIGTPIYSPGDLTGDGIPDLMLARRCGTSLIGSVDVVDGAIGQALFTIESPEPVAQGFFGKQMRAIPDMTGDGKGDWLILQKARIFIFDSQTHDCVITIRNNLPGFAFEPQQIEVIPDINGDGKPELLISNFQDASVRRNNRTFNNAGRAIVRSLPGGELLYELQDPDPKEFGGFGFSIAGLGDISGDQVEDIAVSTYTKDSGAGFIYMFSGKDGQWLRTLRSGRPQAEGRFGWRIEALPDLNGDRIPELFTQEDGADHAYVYDGVTSILLKTIDYPGQTDPIFFTGTIRQAAPPGIYAYLFSAANEISGRVYHMRFTGVPRPLRLFEPEMQANTCRFKVLGESGQNVQIQTSADLQNWENLKTVNLQTTPVPVEDTVTAPRRFYRAKQP